MSNVSKGPKRVVRVRPLTSTFKPRPSHEIDDRPYIKRRKRDDRDDRPRRDYQDSRPRRDSGGPPRDHGGPPRGRGGPPRDHGGPPRGRGGFGDRKWGDKPAGRPQHGDRYPSDNRMLMDTMKRLESGMSEIMRRLTRIEKEIEGLKQG